MSQRLVITGGVTAACAALAVTSLVSPATAAKGGAGSTGTATVFMVNPVQSTGDESLTDTGTDGRADSVTAVPADAYAQVPLTHLDGSGYLRGDYASVESATGKAAYSATNDFTGLNRGEDQFEQVMAYFWVTQAQTYLHELGFGSTLPEVRTGQLDLKIDQYGGDNSYETDKPFRLRYGKGGVDDAEDAEVIVHEFGHAVHQAQVPGFGGSLDAGSIGEAWGDYFGVSVGLDAAEQYGWPVKADPSCPMDWDSSAYTAAPHCIRSFHTGLTVADRQGEVHYDGQIWSQALWEIREGYQKLGLGSRAWDTTLVDSQFDYAPDTSFAAAAEATYKKALERDGQAAADLVRARFADRGITING